MRTKDFGVVRFAIVAALAVALAGCSSQPNHQTNGEPQPSSAGQSAAKAKPTQPAEFATGREAFQHLYGPARQWAVDAQPIGMQSVVRPENKADGRSDVWAASFASPGRKVMKPFIWSGTQDDSFMAGVTPGNEDTFSPTNVSTTPFDPSSLKMDTDKALSTANQHGGKEVLKKDAKTPVKYQLVWEAAKNQLLWHVIYGNNENTAKLVVIVDASTGKFVKVVK